jgi:hypothetical protein
MKAPIHHHSRESRNQRKIDEPDTRFRQRDE